MTYGFALAAPSLSLQTSCRVEACLTTTQVPAGLQKQREQGEKLLSDLTLLLKTVLYR